MTRRIAAFLILATSLLAAPAFAQAPAAPQGAEPLVIRQTELDREVKRIAAQIRCVVCRGQSIQDSPSELAQEMRAVVREQLMAGKTEEEVKAFFIESYGQQVLLQPEAKGFNLLIYVLPVLVFIGGAVFVFLKARSLAAASEAPAEVEG
ncbi:MAG TPA: cytochrome c-type biogenesis protein [Longimicrobiales bacterium]|nr:cytochrome c-type biogenesis protein [Longimicrobiales bacterium]